MTAIASDIMSIHVLTTTADARTWHVARLMLTNGFGGLPVVDVEGRLIGMVSGFDVISKKGVTIGEIMSRGVVWASPSDSFEDVVQLMGLHGIRRVPVCLNGQIVGIISRSDLLRYRTEEHEQENM